MDKKIKEYIDNLFLRKNMSNQTKLLKENLLKKSLEFYNDLINYNLNQNEAYEKTISYINDMYDLVNNNNNESSLKTDPYSQKKSAILTSIAVMLYILSPVPLIILESFGYYFEIFGLVLLFLMVAIATGLLIYNSMIKKNYFHNKSYEYNYGKYNKLIKSISSMMWVIIIVIYFFVSFRYMIWSYSWIIFLIGAALEQVIRAYFDYKEEKECDEKI